MKVALYLVLRKFICRRTFHYPIFLMVSLSLLIDGCAPTLTIQEKKEDIQFLADWADHYSPFVEAQEQFKGCPSYRDLLGKYLEYAEQAESNEEFLYIVQGYFHLICNSGHAHMYSDGWWQGDSRANYWMGLYEKHCLAYRPFRVFAVRDDYYIGDLWKRGKVVVPAGSKILTVNGMSPSAYLEFVKANSWLRYHAADTRLTKTLLAINEGEGFKGWQVEFLAPDGKVHRSFVPGAKGRTPRSSFVDRTKDNCVCVELNDHTGYIRIKTFGWRYNKADHQRIRRFFVDAKGKYDKVIIDLRHNGGGDPVYFYELLITPFLKEPSIYSHVTGLKRRYLADTDPSMIERLRFAVSQGAYVVKVEEVEPPLGFDADEWIVYEITRQIWPYNLYVFDGEIYVLIDNHSYSAVDDYANAVKRIGYATLVGTNTGGGAAAYIGPPSIRLPNSGMKFRVETDLVINPDGSINEIVGTPPDIKLPPADIPSGLTREALLEDEWIKSILAKARRKGA
ncbi:MAG: S41 family peptidase [Planctomycetota bacterium]